MPLAFLKHEHAAGAKCHFGEAEARRVRHRRCRMKDLSTPRTRLVTRQVALVWALTFVTFFAAFQLFPTVPLRLRELGASLAESGRFMSLFTAGSAQIGRASC